MDIDDLVKGSIDMHLHHGPVAGPCRFDALELAEQAQQAGMKAIVLKDSGFPNAQLAVQLKRVVPGIEIIGSICLNFFTGGINHHAVESSAQLGARVVWMPTYSSVNSIDKFRSYGLPLEGEGVSLLDENGQLTTEVKAVLAVVKKYDMVLATGHISPAEIFALFEEATKLGIRKLLVTHPLDPEFSDQVPSMDEIKRLVAMGATIELTFVCHLPTEFSRNPKHTAAAIKEIGAEHCIISTDLGLFMYNPPPVEGMRMFIASLMRNGITDQEIELMAKVNPSKLLGLD